MMKLIKYVLAFTLLATTFCFINVNAETYFCSTPNFVGDFNPDAKGGTDNCEHLRDLTLAYEACMMNSKIDETAYKLGSEAYKAGQCVPYQTATMKFGTASCSAKFIAAKEKVSLAIDTAFGTDEDRNTCYTNLQKKLLEEYPELNRLYDKNE